MSLEAKKHTLLTVLGMNPRRARYLLKGREAEASLAPIALMELLPEEARPERVLAICTPEVEDSSLPLLKKALGTPCQSHPIHVPGGDAQQDVDTFLKEVVGAIDKDAELTVDVTHGFRHFSFLMYIGVLYLVALRGVTVRGAYYGMLNSNGPSHFFDLRPLLDLPRWVYALEVLQDTGSTLPMAKNLLDGREGQTARDIARDLKRLSEAYLSALPLELGWQARNILAQRRKPLSKLLDKDQSLPLAGELVKGLAKNLKSYAINGSASGDGWKGQMRLCTNELKRQAKIIDGLLCQHENFANAFGLMSEWLVSWAVYQQTPDEDWLKRKVRERAAGVLHAIKAICDDTDLCEVLTEEQRQLGAFWKDLTDVRNAYAHHGMRGEDLVRDRTAADTRVREGWKVLRSSPTISLSIGESPGRYVLVSPIGQHPGVLFSALRAFQEKGGVESSALCLVICSHETKGMIAEALSRAGFSGQCKPLILEDAFAGGATEIKRIAKAARKHLAAAAEVFVNVTGGTTLMGLVAQKLADEVRSLACPVRCFGLIDRRSTQQQDADPYQTGEPFWLDSFEDNGAD